MEAIRDIMKKKNTCGMALIIIYDHNGGNAKEVYRLSSCVVYSIKDNDFFIDYFLCQSKTLRPISSKLTFGETSFNVLLGIGITELLMNLVSCHNFMRKQIQLWY